MLSFILFGGQILLVTALEKNLAWSIAMVVQTSRWVLKVDCIYNHDNIDVYSLHHATSPFSGRCLAKT